MTFTLAKDTLIDYGLLLSGVFDAPNRVIIAIVISGLSHGVIDGVITDHQVVPSNRVGESQLIVSGKDISQMLDLEEKNATFPNQSDSVIALSILKNYATLGLVPHITPTTDVPIELERIPSQQGTDLAFLRELAQRNGFVFYIEPTVVPGINTAYWGIDNRLGVPQPALTMNMGSATNVDTPINFHFDALAPASPQVTIVEPFSRMAISIPVPTGLRPSLANQPAQSLRKTVSRDVAGLNPIQAALRGLAAATQTTDALQATGTVDVVRYGHVLQARKLVGVRGVGHSYNGYYYVKEVQHTIKKGEYTQQFTLIREGRGVLTQLVEP